MFKAGKPIPSSEITPERIWLRRRDILSAAGSVAALGGLASVWPGSAARAAQEAAGAGQPLPAQTDTRYVVTDKQTPLEDVTSYNNYYEFGLDKGDPARYASALRTSPWSVTIEGEVNKPGVYDLEKLLKLSAMQERVYRLRCVEGWSMVIPWVGYSLAELIRQVEPRGNAKFVQFFTDLQPENMRGVRSRVLDWPYTEALRMDEAMHPLTLLTFGVYGQTLPKQNGAPLRLIVPWKYGFKSAKSLVKIRFVEQQPTTSWIQAAPSEYGFYANVNPDVSHPRWSQATERRIGEDGFFAPKRKTLPFNGYAEQVASLYQGMDLKANY